MADGSDHRIHPSVRKEAESGALARVNTPEEMSGRKPDFLLGGGGDVTAGSGDESARALIGMRADTNNTCAHRETLRNGPDFPLGLMRLIICSWKRSVKVFEHFFNSILFPPF